jgi:hypothetical protein
MKILITAFFLLFFTPTIKSQVVEYFAANENSNDTLADLRYFKNVDKSIVQKLDSFFSYVKTRKDNNENGFIEFSLFKNNWNKMTADISINSLYIDYSIFTSIKDDFGNVFAFTWYKSKLVLFTFDSPKKYKIKKGYSSILHDLIYPEMSNSVRKEIDRKSDEFKLNGPGIGKRYYFD